MMDNNLPSVNLTPTDHTSNNQVKVCPKEPEMVIPPVTPCHDDPHNKMLIFILVLLTLISLSSAVFFAFRYYQTKSTTNINPTPTPGLYVVDGLTPTPTDGATNWQTLTSDQFELTLKYPNSWTYYKNGNNDVLKLPYVKSLSAKNETLMKAGGCAIHFGFGGAEGPSNDIQSQTVSIGSLNYTKKTWLINDQPVFTSYLYEGASSTLKKFELLFTWVSEKDSDVCQKEIDQILSTFRFLDNPSVTSSVEG